MSENLNVLVYTLPDLKIPSLQIRLTGIISCTPLGIIKRSLSCRSMVCKVLIMLLLRLLFMFSNCGLQYFIVDIGGLEQQPLGHKKLRAYKRRDELFCRHAVIAKEPKRRKGRGPQDAKPPFPCQDNRAVRSRLLRLCLWQAAKICIAAHSARKTCFPYSSVFPCLF